MGIWPLCLLLAALVLALGVFLGGCLRAPQGAPPVPQPVPGAQPGPAAPVANAARGKELWANTCVSCHGVDARGLPGLGKDLVKPSAWMAKQNEAQLQEFVKKGRSVADPENTTKVDMPPKGGNPALTDQDIADIVAHVRELQRAEVKGR